MSLSVFNINNLKRDFISAGYSERLLAMLLFMFPLLSLSVRHWLSGIYTLIVLLSLIFIYKSSFKLRREEKILLSLFALYILSFVISGMLNDWTENTYRRLGTALKYLFFIPMYLLIRDHPLAQRFLVFAIPTGGIVMGIQAIHDTFFTAYGCGNGIYGPIIFGDLAALFAGFTLVSLSQIEKNRVLFIYLFLCLLLSGLAVYLSGSRNAWLACAVILLLVVGFIKKNKASKYLFAGAIVTSIFAVIVLINQTNSLNQRLDRAFNEFNSYFAVEDKRSINLNGNSIGTRLEQWRIASKIITEYPLLGVGPGNIGIHINEYVEKGIANQSLYGSNVYTKGGHVHSAYFETAAVQGMAGFSLLILIFAYPLVIFYKKRKTAYIAAYSGMVLIIGFMIFSLSENPFIHDNFTSIFLTYLAVFFSRAVKPEYEDTGVTG